MKIKVCGMRDPENIVELATLDPDYLGLIFYSPSKRFVGNPDKEVLNSLPKSVKLVGVFVDELMEVVLDKIKEYNLSAIQLHGSESFPLAVAMCTRTVTTSVINQLVLLSVASKTKFPRLRQRQ